MPVRGFYINLDRSLERRAQVEAEVAGLAGVGNYRRFAAVDGALSPVRPELGQRGALGCFLSHLQLMRENVGSPDWLHVVEDDVMVSRYAAAAIEMVAQSPIYGHLDLVFTNLRFWALPWAIGDLAERFDIGVDLTEAGDVERLKTLTVVELPEIDFCRTTSYLVNPASIGKVAQLLERELSAPAVRLVDRAIAALSLRGELRVGCMIPFVTRQRPDTQSTIDAQRPDGSALLEVVDDLFYVDRDTARLKAALARPATAPERESLTRQLISEAYRRIVAG